MSFIDLTNAPTPPRWFEFLLEPGRLQQHLETDKCDPSPSQLITLFLKNILSAEMHETSDVSIPIPQDSFEAKYRHKKTDALQMLSIKVASYLGWDLDIICKQLTIPIQYGLMQAFVNICSKNECPVEVKGFATLVNCHWYIKSAISYKLSTLEPQTSSTTMIYLSNLQQQQQAADHLSLMYMGEVLSDTSEQLRKYVVDLYDFIMKLVTGEGLTKKMRSSGHPFERAKLYRPTMECFKPFEENDWTKYVPVDSLKLLEVACYDLGRYYFFEENYGEAKKMFEIIKDSSDEKFPLLKEYIQSSIEMLAKTVEPDETTQAFSLTKIKREQAEKYLFDCMTQYSKSSRSENSKSINGFVKPVKSTPAKKDIDLRVEFLQLTSKGKNEASPWYMLVPCDYQQQQLLELSRGDVCMSQGDFAQAMGCYVGALMLMTDYFKTFTKSYIDEEPYITRMIQCSISLSCHTQAVALCQMTKSLNYTIAFKQLNERICNDCCDDIYECIWNVTLLEYIINLHARRGEVERRTKAIQLIGQLELNENNPEDVLREAENVRRGRFFRIMSNKYL